jgi:hypothetical protein
MDVFDPSCAPGVATPSWGGLSAREGLEFLRGLSGLGIIADYPLPFGLDNVGPGGAGRL